jgi:sulfur dioxygenase
MNKNNGGYIRQGHAHKARIHHRVGELGMRQLFDDETSTYTYLLWDKETEDAVLVDPVLSQIERDLRVSTNLHLIFGVNTHCHADHITATGELKKRVPGLQSVISKSSGARADIMIEDGDEIHFGNRFVTALATPGHTEGCTSFITDDGRAVLTGDTLFVMGCGRTDFQGGSSETLYDSVHEILFTLPDTCIVFPGHDYNGKTHSTIGKEKMENPRLNIEISKQHFVEVMANLNLPEPKQMDVAVPANLKDGTDPFFVKSLRGSPKERWGVFG